MCEERCAAVGKVFPPPQAPCADKPIGYMREAPNPTLGLRNAGSFSKDRLVAQIIARYEPRGGQGVSVDASSAKCVDERDTHRPGDAEGRDHCRNIHLPPQF
ncbi:hypothetical protein ACOME3_010570 [Neoechinorhynchus agilis]